MSKFIGYTTGFEADGKGLVRKMVKIEYSRLNDGRVKLQATNGRDLSALPGTKTIGAEEFDARPTDPYNEVAEARWALALCGWSLMAESGQ